MKEITNQELAEMALTYNEATAQAGELIEKFKQNAHPSQLADLNQLDKTIKFSREFISYLFESNSEKDEIIEKFTKLCTEQGDTIKTLITIGQAQKEIIEHRFRVKNMH